MSSLDRHRHDPHRAHGHGTPGPRRPPGVIEATFTPQWRRDRERTVEGVRRYYPDGRIEAEGWRVHERDSIEPLHLAERKGCLGLLVEWAQWTVGSTFFVLMFGLGRMLADAWWGGLAALAVVCLWLVLKEEFG